MKKILYIEECNFKDYPLGGHLSFALHLIRAMKGDIDLAGIRTDNDYPEGKWSICEYSGYKYEFYNMKNVEKHFKRPLVPGRITGYFRAKKHISKILSHKEYDIIIVQTPEVLMNIPSKYRKKVCLIMPGVGNPLKISRYKWARMFASIYDKFFFHYAKSVHKILAAADSKALTEFIKRSKGRIKSETAVQFPTRYDAEIFNIKDKASVRALLGVPKDELMIVTTGRLNWFKGWKFMIDAFKIFIKNHDNAKLYFIGKGEDEDKIKEYILSEGLSDKVILAGVHPLPTVANYLNAADMFIMGSYFEGWSTSLVESIACALPCVVTEFSSAHDLVKDGENGFVHSDRDETVFAEFMEKSLRLDMSIIKQHAERAYTMSVQTMRKQLNNILCIE